MSIPTEDKGRSGPETTPDSKPTPQSGKGPKLDYLNTTTAALTYDAEGHQVAGGEWTGPVQLDEVGQRAVESGYLTRL